MNANTAIDKLGIPMRAYAIFYTDVATTAAFIAQLTFLRSIDVVDRRQLTGHSWGA